MARTWEPYQLIERSIIKKYRDELWKPFIYLKRDNPNIEKSIFNSIHAVSLDTFPGYKTGGEVHSFLDHYDL